MGASETFLELTVCNEDQTLVSGSCLPLLAAGGAIQNGLGLRGLLFISSLLLSTLMHPVVSGVHGSIL